VSGEIKQLLVINHTHAQPVQEADAPDDVDRKVFSGGKIDHRLPAPRVFLRVETIYSFSPSI